MANYYFVLLTAMVLGKRCCWRLQRYLYGDLDVLCDASIDRRRLVVAHIKFKIINVVPSAAFGKWMGG